jgi:hypothetical protein
VAELVGRGRPTYVGDELRIDPARIPDAASR